MITRRTFFKRGVKFWLSSLLLTSSVYVYSRYIEPKNLDIQHVPIVSKKIPAAFHDVRLVQFSDTHLSRYYSLTELNELVTRINELDPHIILFTGDLMDNPFTYREVGKISEVLKKLQAPLGKFAVYGNHDHGGYGTTIYKQVMETSHFQLLSNEVVAINKENSIIMIAGLDDVIFKRHRLQETLAPLSERTFNILLAHEPDIADETATFHVDFQISGHTHGGQIQLPLIGSVITPEYGHKYVEGLYQVSKSNMYVYVNRGIGTTRLPMRFLSSPELTIFTLKHRAT